LTRNISKTVIDTWLDPTEDFEVGSYDDFFESSHELSIGIVRFDLG